MKVLVVDDDDDVRRIALASLRLVGCARTCSAASGEEALDVALRERPDVILMDMMMPGMDGLATLTALRRLDDAREIPVVFLTAKVQPHEVCDYIAQGAAGVIVKPFDPMTLTDDVRRLLGRARAEGASEQTASDRVVQPIMTE